MNTITNVFGTDVFNDSVMKARLPKETYRQLQRTMKEGKHLDNACLLYTSLIINQALSIKIGPGSFIWFTFVLVLLLGTFLQKPEYIK